MKQQILFFLFVIVANMANAQKTATIRGHFETGKPGDTVYLISTQEVKHPSIIDNNKAVEFKFEPEISDLYFIQYPKSATNIFFPIFITEGSAISIWFDKNYNYVKFTGDALAKEQNSFYAGLFKYYGNYETTQNKIAASTDETELSALNIKMSGILKEYEDYYLDWISSHRESPFSAAIISAHLRKPFQNDTLVLEYFKMLTKEATANNAVASRLASILSMYDDAVSVAPIKSRAPDFNISDTSGTQSN